MFLPIVSSGARTHAYCFPGGLSRFADVLVGRNLVER